MTIFSLAVEIWNNNSVIETKRNINKNFFKCIYLSFFKCIFKLGRKLFNHFQKFSSLILLVVQMKKVSSIYLKQIEVPAFLL